MTQPEAPPIYQSLKPTSARSEGFDEQDLMSPAIYVVDGSHDTRKNGEESDSDEEAGLDTQERTARRDRRYQDTSPNGRIAPEILSSKDEKRLADLAVLKTSLVNVVLIGLWYTFSVSISLVGRSFGTVTLADPCSIMNGCSRKID